MGLAAILTIFGVGLVVGLVSGLVGIGGGVLIVPFLYFFYERPELFGVVVPSELVVVMAHATSLFVIVPTSVRGAYAFHKARLVEWRAVWPIAFTSIFAAAAGARLAVELPPELLKLAFGTLLIISALRLVWRRRASGSGEPRRKLRLSLGVTLLVGSAVGLFSALMGVGGGIVGIPLLISVVGLEIRRVAATSIGIISITATAGALAYMVTGAGVPGVPPWSIGYVHVAAGVVMFAGSVLSVRWGALLNQRLQPRALSLLFAIFFLLLGAELVVTNATVLLTAV